MPSSTSRARATLLTSCISPCGKVINEMAGTFTDTFNVFAVDKVEKMMGGEKVKVHEKQFDKGKSLIPYSKQISILA